MSTTTLAPPVTGFLTSRPLAERAHALIPAGCHTYSKGDDQFPQNAPALIVRAAGCYAYDPAGNEFLDWGMGLRSVILGHAYPPILDAVRKQLELGSNFTRPSPLEADLAEQLARLIPCAEMVKLAKNGSDVTTAAVRLARAHTGRDLVAVCAEHPFFSFDDWFIGSTPCNAGIPEAVRALTKTFHYDDLPSLARLFQEHPGQIAAVVLEPATTARPQPGFLEGVRQIATEHGAVLIFDEMITGFRWHLSGAQTHYGVTPDLATFGKALGNGFSIAALVGKREIMKLGGLHHQGERVFLLSSTHGGETHSIAAALATLAELEQRDVITHLWRVGEQFCTGLSAVARELGLAGHVRVVGYPCSPAVVLYDAAGAVSLPLRTLFLQELIRRGVLMPYVAVSFAHGEAEVARTVEAAREALRVVALALEDGVERYLVGPPVKPVFRRFN